MAKRPGGAMVQNQLPTRSQLVPVLTKWRELSNKSALWPMVVTILFVLGMYAADAQNPYAFPIDLQEILHLNKWPDVGGQPVYTTWFIILVATYLNLASLYFIYRLAGKKKSWVLLVGAAVFTAYVMTSPVFDLGYQFFYGFLAGGSPSKATDFVTKLYRYIIGTGLFEELLKAVPLFVIYGLTQYLKPQHREKYGIQEPLDGILIGAASAAGFAMIETVGQYISSSIEEGWMHGAVVLMNNHYLPGNISVDSAKLLMAKVMGCFPGVGLAVPRSLDQAFGHMAYSGYLGYFIGLAALKPEKRWKILGIGLISSAVVHGLWDAIPGSMTLLEMVIAVISYAVLAAAILKARELSPQRAFLQPSIIFGDAVLAPAASFIPAAPVAAVANPIPPSEAPKPVVVETGGSGSSNLKIGNRRLTIVPGLRLLAHQIPGLKPQGEEDIVAEIVRNPEDPAVLGLKNLSTSAWEVVTSQGNRREIQPGQTVKLSTGTKIDFGSTDGEVA
jgi:RsiW-degrading membrane proteinase PrsW (M82 family)